LATKFNVELNEDSLIAALVKAEAEQVEELKLAKLTTAQSDKLTKLPAKYTDGGTLRIIKIKKVWQKLADEMPELLKPNVHSYAEDIANPDRAHVFCLKAKDKLVGKRTTHSYPKAKQKQVHHWNCCGSKQMAPYHHVTRTTASSSSGSRKRKRED
jgi:hypothetical protein